MSRSLPVLWLLAAGAAHAAAPAVEVLSRTHPAVYQDFDTGAAPFAPLAAADEPATVEHRLVPVEGRGRVLEIRNAVPGGFVATTMLRPRRDQAFLSHVAFDYQADPRLKVNLHARVEFQNYEFGFLGPPADDGSTIFLGTPGTPQGDGQWHRYELPLLAYVRKARTGRSTARLSSLTIENRHQGDYLLAGFGGNPAGATLRLDNFVAYRPGPADATFDLSVPRDSKIDGFAAVIDQQPATTPPEGEPNPAKTISRTGLTDGEWYLHVRAKETGGDWGPITHYRFVVDTTPPNAGEVRPEPGAAACPAAWSCRLTDAGAGVAPPSLLVAVREGEPKFKAELEPDQAEATTELTVSAEALAFDPTSGLLQVLLGRLPGRFADGATIGVAVKAADENGVPLEPLRSTFILRAADDGAPPERPRLHLRLPGGVTAFPLPGDGTFEYGLDEWRPYENQGVVLERTRDTAAGGLHSLRLRCTENASYFTVIARSSGFDAGRFRTLSFDYKAPDRLRVDMALKVNGQYVYLRFTDRDVDDTIIADGMPPVIADDQWHHLEVPLYELLRKRIPNSPSLVVEMILFTGAGFGGPTRRYPGNYAGTEYFIDNFTLIPTLGADTRLEWTGDDATGVIGALVATAATAEALPAADATDVGQRLAGDGVALDDLEQGNVFLWARLADARGNLSTPVVTRFLVDAGKPVTGAVWPADGSRVAPDDLGLELRDERGAGLDLASVVLEVAGRPFTVDGKILRYDAAAGRLTWDVRLAREKLDLADGQAVTVRLAEARDQAGNRPETLPSWSFTVDYSQDRVGPTVVVTSQSHSSFVQESFDGPTVTTLRVEPEGAASAELVPAEGRAGRVLRLNPGGREAYTAWLELPGGATAIRYPLLRFDYRLPPGAAIDLVVAVLDAQNQRQVRAVELTDPSPGIQRIGRIDGIVADGTWRVATVQLNELLSRAGLRVPGRIAAVGFADSGEVAAPTPIDIDHVALLAQRFAPSSRLSLSALDVTGVAGYSYTVDRQVDTVAPEQVTTTTPEIRLADLPPGETFVHVRAVDGAGNWGPTTHYCVMVWTRGT